MRSVFTQRNKENMYHTCKIRKKKKKRPHEYSTILGIEESVHEILMNLKEIVWRSNLYNKAHGQRYEE